METLVRQYRAYDRTLAKMPFEKLDKLHYNVHTEVPYVIYTETAEDNSMDTKVNVYWTRVLLSRLTGCVRMRLSSTRRVDVKTYTFNRVSSRLYSFSWKIKN